MIYVFVDETGDPGKKNIFARGSTPYFGLVAISVIDKDYNALRSLLSQIHWLRGTASTINLRRTYNKALDSLRGLKELARIGMISSSALYIKKAEYGGRYMAWSDIEAPRSEWNYYLRNYLLRHLLELHFSNGEVTTESIDLILDRVLLSEKQRKNTVDYLNSRSDIGLREPFALPPIEYMTICDSEYVGGLEIAHVLADVLKEKITGVITPEVQAASDFIRFEYFVGHRKGEL